MPGSELLVECKIESEFLLQFSSGKALVFFKQNESIIEKLYLIFTADASYIKYSVNIL